MQAFHSQSEVKEKYLARVRAHQAADNLIRGRGWENGKGCAVGCTLEDYDHAKYETELGIPEWLARVEDRLFEGMSEEKSLTWPELFLKAIPIGADLQRTKTPFTVMLLKHTLVSLDQVEFDADRYPGVESVINGAKVAVNQMIAGHKSGDKEAISVAKSVVALVSGMSVAASAPWSAAEAAVASAAEEAGSTAWSASAAEEAGSTAWSAAEAAVASAAAKSSGARSGEAWSTAWSAAEAAAYDYYADELLKILAGCG